MLLAGELKRGRRFEKAGTVKEVCVCVCSSCSQACCISYVLQDSNRARRHHWPQPRVTIAHTHSPSSQPRLLCHFFAFFHDGLDAPLSHGVRYSYVDMGSAADVEKALSFNHTMLGSRCVADMLQLRRNPHLNIFLFLSARNVVRQARGNQA